MEKMIVVHLVLTEEAVHSLKEYHGAQWNWLNRNCRFHAAKEAIQLFSFDIHKNVLAQLEGINDQHYIIFFGGIKQEIIPLLSV